MSANPYGTTYHVDIAMVIDATGSMGPLIDLVKKNALHFYDDLRSEMAKKNKRIDEVRVRVIAFRDYLADQDYAMMMTPFFKLPEQAREFEYMVQAIQPIGGGDDPEDGLEALGYAIRSPWTKGGSKRRHVIVVWTDEATHPLGFGRAAPNYPQKMAKTFTELTTWWGCGGVEGSYMEKRAKRLLIYAPLKEYWTTIAETWDEVVMFPSEAGKGLDKTDYSEILNAICGTLS